MTTEQLLTTLPSGEMKITGYDGKEYALRFGWLSRLQLESIYGPALANIKEEKDDAMIIANVVLSGLLAKSSNQVSKDIAREDLFTILDDMGEERVKQAYEAGMHALGFTQRILGLSPEDVKRLGEEAVKSQAKQTGKAS